MDPVSFQNLPFNQQHVLVVGGAGFVGSNLCHRLLQEGVSKITVVDNLLSAEVDNLPQDPKVHFVFGSITDDRILEKIGKDFPIVFHLATYHGNQASLMDPLADHQNNTLTTLKLCEHFKNASSLKKMVYASAGCTVAQKTFETALATTEEDPVSLYLDSPYQISKIIGEFYGNFYWKRHDLPFVKARFQNVYGPREILGAGQWRGTPATVWRNVTPTFIWKALAQEPLPLDKGGVATRDFIYIDDIVQGLIDCALKGEAGEVYNLASGVEIAIRELAVLINTLTHNPAPLEDAAPRAWDRSGKRFAETSKAEEKLGFRAKMDLAQGIKQTLAWTTAHASQIQQAILKHVYFLPEIKKYA